MRHVFLLLLCSMFLVSCSSGPSGTGGSYRGVNLKKQILPPNYHGRLVNRTMSPRFLTIHATENRNATARNHAMLLSGKGLVSRNNPRFGRSGWVVWHFTVDDEEAYQHLLPTEQGDHADYGGGGDRQSIGIEICEFSSPSRQAAAIERAARLAGQLASQYNIPRSRIVPHMHWPRWDFAAGKPCPKILMERDSTAPSGWRLGSRWEAFLDRVDRYR